MPLLERAERDLLAVFPVMEAKEWHWEVTGNGATVRPDQLILLPWVDMVNALYARGWRRDGSPSSRGGDVWNVWADLREGEYLVRFLGVGGEEERPHPHAPAIPFFADPPPPIPGNNRISKAFKEAMAEWDRKTREGAW